MKIANKFSHFAVTTILIIWSCILLLLFMLSVFNSSYDIEFVQDNWICSLFILLSFLILLRLSRQFHLPAFFSKYITPIFSSKMQPVFFVCIAFLFILSTQVAPFSDGQKVFQIAEGLRQYDYSAFVRGGYIDRYPHQLGLILYYYILSFLTGKHNYVMIQILNAVFFSIALYDINRIFHVFYAKDSDSNRNIYWIYFLFVPLFSYIIFVYGTIPSLSFSIFSIYHLVIFLKNERVRDSILSSVFIGIALVLKTNSLIMWVALVIFLICNSIVCFLRNRKCSNKYLVYLLLLVMSLFLAQKGPKFIAEAMTGMMVSEGEPMSSYVVMGLMETAVGPGSSHPYPIEVYQGNNYDTHAADLESKEMLKTKLISYSKDPKRAISFFVRKTAFQWNNPSFRCISMLSNRTTTLEESPVLKLYVNEQFQNVLLFYLNIFQILILFGALLFICFNRKECSLTELIFAVIFIGGFLFHTFWESSPYYTFPYFLLLFPYSLQGYHLFKISENRKAAFFPITVLLAFTVFMAPLFSFFGISYKEYLENHPMLTSASVETNPSGFCSIRPKTNEALYLSTDNGLYTGNHPVCLTPFSEDSDFLIGIYHSNGTSTLRFRSRGTLLSMDMETSQPVAYHDDYKSLYYLSDLKVNYAWDIIPSDNKLYYIEINGLALTCHSDNSVTLEPFANAENQLWIIE